MRRSLQVTFIVTLLAASACTSSNVLPPSDTSGVATAAAVSPSTATTQPASTTTTGATAQAVATKLQTKSSSIRKAPPWFMGWASGVYQSSGYSCGPDPSEGCFSEPSAVRQTWLGNEADEPQFAFDFIDFWTNGVGGSPGEPDKQTTLGLGVRIVPLERGDLPTDAPPVSGATFLEVTVSGLTASVGHPQKMGDAPEVISDLVLVESTDDMMQWIIGLENEGHHLYKTIIYTEPAGLQILISEASDDTTGERVRTNAYASGDYQSPAYACGPDPTIGCGDDPVLETGSVTYFPADTDHDVGCVNFHMGPGPSPYAGWGVRISQLDRHPDLPPGEEPLPGEAWLEITLSGTTANSTATAADPKLRRITAGPNVKHITASVLVATTDDMTQWIIGLDEPGLYEYEPMLHAGPGLWIHIRQAP